MGQQWDPPFIDCCQPLYGAPRGDCPGDCPWPPPRLWGSDMWTTLLWSGWISWAPQHTTQEHQVHCRAWEGEQASIPRCPGDQDQQQVDHKTTHIDCYIPFFSHNHQRTVTGVLRCMRCRANNICDRTSKQKEFQPPSRLSSKWFPGWTGEEDALAPDPPHRTSTWAWGSSRTREDHVPTLHPWPQWKSMQPTRGKSSLQTHKDTEADPDEHQELHPRRKEKKGGLWGSLQGVPAILHWGNKAHP